MLIIRKIIAYITVLSLLLGIAATAFAETEPTVSAESAVIMHDGVCIFNKNADTRLPMASTTKIMTAILAIESGRTDERFEIPPECCGAEGSSMYLKAGESYTLRELITGLLLASGNDAAGAIAVMLCVDEAEFVAQMNRKAAELGMNDTHFENPSGLPSPTHFSTARDMACLMEYCMGNPLFAEISALKSAEIKNQHFTNHNKLLTIYNGCIGGKTGYTMEAGRCLVSCTERDGLRLVCVTLSAPDDWNDHCRLYDWAYSEYECRNITENAVSIIPVFSGTRKRVPVRPLKDLFLFTERGEDYELVYELPPFVFAPVSALSRAGRLIIKHDGEIIAGTELYYCESIPVLFPD